MTDRLSDANNNHLCRIAQQELYFGAKSSATATGCRLLGKLGRKESPHESAKSLIANQANYCPPSCRNHMVSAQVRFEDFELDLRSGELHRDGSNTVRFPEQPFRFDCCRLP